MSVVNVRDVTIRYGRNVAVDGVTFSVEAGSVYALLGRNGAGKSSLVRCIVGQQKPRAGSVALFERDAWRHRQELMERTGVVAEDADAPPEMTVAQIERFCSRIYAKWDVGVVNERLRRFGIEFNTICAALAAVNTDHCSPPMADAEVRKITASIMRYASDTRDVAK